MKNDQEIIEKLKIGGLDSSIKEFIIERTIPLSKFVYLHALYLLLEDSYFKNQSQKRIDNIDITTVEEYLSENNVDFKLANYLYFKFKDRIGRKAIKKIINNFSIPPLILIDIGKGDDKEILELLSYKQIKLLAHPEVIETLINNEFLDRERRYYLKEMKERFIDVVEEEEEIEEINKEEEEIEEISEVEEEEEEVEFEFDMGDDQSKIKINQNDIKKMSVGNKIKFALFGPKEVRKMLIIDPNRLVREAVLMSPKITETEIESFAKQKGIAEDVIRKITINKKWVSKYSISLSLLKNPKTPIGFSLNVLDKLINRDLKLIVKDKDIPDPVRKKAKLIIRRKAGG
jgi:hypothetical protein